MTLFTFEFDEVKLNENDKFETWKLYLKSARNSEVNTIESFLTVKRKPIGPGTDYDWERRFFMFNTENEIQSLIINLHTKEMVGDRPRFHIYGFEAQRDDLVDGLYQRDIENPGEWKRLNPSTLSQHRLSTVKIQFKMPFPTEPFKFRLSVYDLDKAWPVPCDPQVGNGPPKN